ncbi:MAG TPA: hypothetical protein PKD17_05695 [Cellvibrionaceae bacterium]|nr:hypothetical protein [Cellvibrionaceae bacterium]HMW71290.1 hypothetical protein [Cellvibrionaceae bacterium]
MPFGRAGALALAVPLNKWPLITRLMAAWLVMAVVFYSGGAFLLQQALPLVQWIANSLSDNYTAQLSLGSSEQGAIIQIAATVSRNIYYATLPIAPKGAVLTGAGTLVHTLTPLVILFSLLIAWPCPWRVLALRLVIGALLGLLIILGTLPFLLISHIEGTLHAAVQQFLPNPVPMPKVFYWVMFVEMGGLWLLPILAAMGSIALTQRLVLKR